jgi:hypothetical protein
MRPRHAVSLSLMTLAAFAALSQRSPASAGTGLLAADALARPQAPADPGPATVGAYQRVNSAQRIRAHDQAAGLRLYVLQHAKPAAPKVVFAEAPARQAPAPQPAQAAPVQQAPAPPPQQAYGSLQGYAESLVGAAQFACLDPLWERESGWEVSAENPTSGAYGIPQALPGWKMESAGADWQTDPYTQIKWGIFDYIDPVYGSPCGAWAHEEADGWY